ncbi:MAG: hypothetical protein SR1Q7_04630 [Quinella sp. 1Q7]|nr:hypothetical protein [Quinella sp. 1Q7]
MSKTFCGRFGLDKANQIQQRAKNSFGIVLASSSFALIIRQYLEQLKVLESSRAVWLAAFKDSAVSRFYQKKLAEGKNHFNKPYTPAEAS